MVGLIAVTGSTTRAWEGYGPRDQWRRRESDLGQLPHSAVGELPSRPPQYQMNLSTIIMPCNNSGYTDPKSTVGWAIVDFDWSNGKAIWTKHRPMDDEVVLQNQVKMSTSASLGQTIWVYRGSMWAYPWYTSVRKTLEDPAYTDWYIKFKPVGPWYSAKCDKVNTSDCSDLYHNQEQSPGYPTGDGNCAAPNCYCGSNVPCGFYIWNHSSTTVVHNQTFLEWFRDSYVFDYQGTSPLVSGFYFDDFWPESGGFPDPFPHMADDMGLSPEEQKAISLSYHANMEVIYRELLKRGMFSWQQQWNGQASPTAKNGCCTKPLVTEGSTCAPTLRKLCAADSPTQTRVTNYAFAPGSCDGGSGAIPLTAPVQDIANFLLIRGPHAFLGHGWLGCSREYELPEQINWDYGKPIGFCQETAPSSGVFTREWTKASVKMDCNTWTPTIKLKRVQ
jgi:hypothetical protein